MRRPWFVIVACLFAGCGSHGGGASQAPDAADTAEAAAESDAAPTPVEVPGVQVRMDFGRSDGSLYAAPFPSDDLRDPATGDVDLSLLDPGEIDLLARIIAVAETDTDRFGTTATAYVALDGALDPDSLPTLEGSLGAGASVQLLDVDPASPTRLRRYPVEVAFQPDGGPFGAPNLLSALPLQGLPLRAGTRHALVVTRDVLDAGGEPLGVSQTMAELAAGVAPAGLTGAALDAYRAAVAAAAEAGVPAATIAGIGVFTTGDPTADFADFLDHALDQALPTPDSPFALDDVFDTYCVYSSTLAMPVYQHGEPPFDGGGGGWLRDAADEPLPAGVETARVVVTVPRAAPPAEGLPLVVFIRTGGGGDRPLVDRGPHAEPGGPALVDGAGPALHFAAAGWAGVSVDGPHGGLRNVSGGDEQFLMFNVTNPLAMRDNVRQSALEVVLTARLVEHLTVDASDCPGVDGLVAFDPGLLALMGHSMGATIAPLALAFEPRYRAAILSGAGGSWIMNVAWKESPIAVKPAAELLLGYSQEGRELGPHDPALALLQWAGEAADPPAYAARVVRSPAAGEAPRHVLMLQGIVDTYILPPIANSLSLALGLDLATEGAGPLDATHPDLALHAPLGELLPFVGREIVPLPASGNVHLADLAPATALVVQHAEDGVEDGHEIAFQRPQPKRQYRCFLAGLAAGAIPVVPTGDGCPAVPDP